MKTYNKTINGIASFVLCLLSCILLTGCDDFLNQPPYDDFTDEEFWKSEDQARTFMYGFYTSVFSGYGTGTSHGPFLMGQTLNDDFASSPEQSNLQPEVVPVSDGAWSFSNIRKANYVIANVDRLPLAEKDINHWRGVARFFRACYYSNLVFTFGDVPWFDKVPVVSDNKADLDYLYKDRDARTYVDERIIEDFQYALDNVRANDGELQVNKNIVAAMASRFMLREGTFLKYHNLDATMAEKCLTFAKENAAWVMQNGGYRLTSNYNSLFTSDNLADNSEVIMYRHYVDGVLAHSTLAYSYTETQSGLSKSLAEAFVGADGLPIYAKDANYTARTAEEFFANRDPRLTQIIRPKYYIKGEDNQPFAYALSGYSWNKFMNDALAGTKDPTFAREKNVTDAPCLRYAEVLLNYAEAAYELGLLGKYTFTQTDLDKSINLIRTRAGLPALEMQGNQPAIAGVVFDDPKRLEIESKADGGETDALLWEIRRERRIELSLEGFRLNDLKRWKKLDYLWNGCNPDIRYGAYIVLSNYPKHEKEIVLEDSTATEGYILRNTEGQRERPQARNYISPIPSGQINLYAAHGYTLTQNKEWE